METDAGNSQHDRLKDPRAPPANDTLNMNSCKDRKGNEKDNMYRKKKKKKRTLSIAVCRQGQTYMHSHVPV